MGEARGGEGEWRKGVAVDGAITTAIPGWVLPQGEELQPRVPRAPRGKDRLLTDILLIYDMNMWSLCEHVDNLCNVVK